MTDLDLNVMPLDELKRLQKDVTKAVDSYKDRQRKEALAAADAKAREMGFSLSELMTGMPPKGKAKSISPPKYRHPENSDMTWTGRGRQPEWMKDALADGKSKDEFLIES